LLNRKLAKSLSKVLPYERKNSNSYENEKCASMKMLRGTPVSFPILRTRHVSGPHRVDGHLQNIELMIVFENRKHTVIINRPPVAF
jgi:hypothetical protein